MDLINKELSILRKDLQFHTVNTFRQDPKLVEAINKLFYTNAARGHTDQHGQVLLPDRKLNFDDVQKLLEDSSKDKQPQIIKEGNDTKKVIVKKIENILNEINKTAVEGNNPKLIIRNQRLWSNCIYDLDRVTLKAFNDAKKTTVCYSSKEDKTRFNIIVLVLTKVHELLTKSITVTRREIFYQNVVRFRNQGNLDMAVRDVCCLLESPPWDLGIVATAKGLIAGPLTMHYSNGTIVDCETSGGVLIPQDVQGIREFKTTAKYILVVEKDAIFQKLLDEGALIRLGPVVIITGKGYPDVCTRQLLRRLCSELRLKALALVDADPHGYEIFLTYKYGSLAQSHLSSSLACSHIVLIGARYQDVMTLAPREARLRLTDLDKRKLSSLIRRPYLDTAAGALIKQELNYMLESGVKAEIESVTSSAAALCDAYLPSKIIQSDYLECCSFRIHQQNATTLLNLPVATVYIMDCNDEFNSKKCIKAKSCSDDTSGNPKQKSEALKRKSHYVNEAVKTLDMALGRLKKSKLVNGENGSNSQTVSARQGVMDMFMETHPNFSFSSGMDSASFISMNFSQYELMRNLSESNCNSEAAFSGTAGERLASPDELSVKDEHLEKYFQSVEMWRNRNADGPTVPFELPKN